MPFSPRAPAISRSVLGRLPGPYAKREMICPPISKTASSARRKWCSATANFSLLPINSVSVQVVAMFCSAPSASRITASLLSIFTLESGTLCIQLGAKCGKICLFVLFLQTPMIVVDFKPPLFVARATARVAIEDDLSIVYRVELELGIRALQERDIEFRAIEGVRNDLAEHFVDAKVFLHLVRIRRIRKHDANIVIRPLARDSSRARTVMIQRRHSERGEGFFMFFRQHDFHTLECIDCTNTWYHTDLFSFRNSPSSFESP